MQEQVDAGFLTPEQARYHPYSNVITRCVGAGQDVEPDIYRGEVRPGDLYLVASDGLTGMVDDRRLAQLLASRAEPERNVHALIAEANGRGGLDNITAIIVQVLDVGAGSDDPNLTTEAPAVGWLTRRLRRWRSSTSATSCTRSSWRRRRSRRTASRTTRRTTEASRGSWRKLMVGRRATSHPDHVVPQERG